MSGAHPHPHIRLAADKTCLEEGTLDANVQALQQIIAGHRRLIEALPRGLRSAQGSLGQTISKRRYSYCRASPPWLAH